MRRVAITIYRLKALLVLLLAAAMAAGLLMQGAYSPATAATEDTSRSASTEKDTIEIAAATPETDVYCDFGAFTNCANHPNLSLATERFECGGFVQTNNVTCKSKKTDKTYFCDYEGGDFFSGVDLYFCTLPPPTVVRTVPVESATNVAPGANIKAKFSRAMDKSTINTDTVYLIVTGCQAPCEHVPATVSYSKKKKLATLNPTESLEANTQYTAVVEGANDGAPTVKSKVGIAMAETFSWTFTTGSS
jgi:hypothetical protein